MERGKGGVPAPTVSARGEGGVVRRGGRRRKKGWWRGERGGYRRRSVSARGEGEVVRREGRRRKGWWRGKGGVQAPLCVREGRQSNAQEFRRTSPQLN